MKLPSALGAESAKKPIPRQPGYRRTHLQLIATLSGPSKRSDDVVVNFECLTCEMVFDCDVGSVDVDYDSSRPRFANKIVCPRCGERSLDEVLLTELGQDQLTQATLDLDNGAGEIDRYVHYAECQGCDTWLPVNEMGLCDECSGKLDRDLIRQRDWDYSIAAFGLDNAQREELRKQVISKHGARNELISTSSPTRKEPTRPGKKHKRKKRR